MKQTSSLQYQYTNIVAPEDGKVGRLSVETGDQITTGQALMPLIEPNPWVEANFKEGQLAHLYLGQDAGITVDSIPGKVFKGKVDSIAPGSGAVFGAVFGAILGAFMAVLEITGGRLGPDYDGYRPGVAHHFVRRRGAL